MIKYASLCIRAYILCIVLIIVGCSTANTDNIYTYGIEKGEFQVNKPIERINIPRQKQAVAQVIFMPIVVNKTLIKLPLGYESSVYQLIIEQLESIPYPYYTGLRAIQGESFVEPTVKLNKWVADTNNFYSYLNELNINESIAIPEKYTKVNESVAQFILFGELKVVRIGENRDKIPYTSLVSILASSYIRIAFTVISMQNGVIIKKFIATGHSGISKLVEGHNRGVGYNIGYLINDVFLNLKADINDNLSL
ncbi:MAG: hypothetical protein K2P99_05595 [Burkholderiales bacterium]|nr:hypothetical protein [Burkholderiales bacterium]